MNLILATILIVFLGYLIGSLHGAKLAQVLSGVNIKELGVKNSGASNATIILGWKYGALVAILDIGKALLAVMLLYYYLQSGNYSSEQIQMLLYFMGSAVVIGHIYSVWMKFNGGKGTASVIGVLFALDWRVGLIGLILLIVTTLITDYLLVGVLFLYLTFIGYTWWYVEGVFPLVISVALFMLAFFKHKENILRVKNGTEPLVSKVFKKKN